MHGIRLSRSRRVSFPAAAATAGLAMLAAASNGGAQQINTGSPPLGTEGGQALRFTPFFAGNVAQTFVTPVGATTLTQFQFWARNDASNFQALGFRAYLFTWNDATLMAGATPLWSSAVVSGTASATPQAFTFALPGLALTAGQRYAAVLSPLGTAFPPAGATWQGLVFNALGSLAGTVDTYAGGAGYFLQTARGAELSALSTTRWTADGTGSDYAFTATFAEPGGPPSVVPEPATVALLASGLAVLGLGAARARHRPA